MQKCLCFFFPLCSITRRNRQPLVAVSAHLQQVSLLQRHVEPDARMMNSAPAAVTWRPTRHEGEPTCRLHVLQINSIEQEEPDCA